MREKLEEIIKEAAEGGINLNSEVARAVLVEKIMIEIGYFMMQRGSNG